MYGKRFCQWAVALLCFLGSRPSSDALQSPRQEFNKDSRTDEIAEIKATIKDMASRMTTMEGEKKDLEETVAILKNSVTVLEAVAQKILPQTCSHLWELGVTTSGQYRIDPDGSGIGAAPISVLCDFENQGATIVTQETIDVLEALSETQQINELVDLSNECTNNVGGGITCSGRKSFDASKSCKNLRRAGNLQSGLFLVKPTPDYYQVAMCNMDLEATDPNFQVDTGARIADGPVVFDVYRTTDIAFPDYREEIPYQQYAVGLGGGMSLSTGVFTAPRDGVYFFSFFGEDNWVNNSASVYFRKNSVELAHTYSSTGDYNTIAMSTIVELSVNDEVATTLQGHLHSFDSREIHFMGHLLYPTA